MQENFLLGAVGYIAVLSAIALFTASISIAAINTAALSAGPSCSENGCISDYF